MALIAWILSGWYFGAMGIMIGVASEYWEPVEKFIQPIQYLQLPISGVFFMVGWMPDYAQKLLLYNPSVHCFEMFRGGFLGESIDTYYNAGYLIAWSTGYSLIGWFLLYNVRSRIQ